MKDIHEGTPLEQIHDPVIESYGVELFIKRDDLIHPAISGNKWRKLKYNIEEAKRQKKRKLLTFGGAYSNHIYAVAYAGKRFGFETVGIIRGEEHLPLNATLTYAKSVGMELLYMDRATFRKHDNEEIIEELKQQLGDFYLVPMGGTNRFAIPGCMEIVKEVNAVTEEYDYICSACGTGGTLAGIIVGMNNNKKVIGFPALKGADFLSDDINTLLHESEVDKAFNNWELNLDYHFGGYAKKKPELMSFIKGFQERTGVELEFIYTGKMMFGIYDLIQNGFFKRGEKVIAVHTGGLQVNH
ncbi:pyridoxal-phosphate dependent enzyme [Limibacter armeniacum]|uniref:1-aminocyclopropane-1-carboxylate deaminase/D-cysteine desulfhydrase n=1 Tax=Limibacter armeniacum TaxID=466084 RepID=UPI002FE63EFC